MFDSLVRSGRGCGAAVQLALATGLVACLMACGSPASIGSTGAGEVMDAHQPAAEVDGEVITFGELHDAVAADLKKARDEFDKEVHRFKLQKLRSLIDERLIADRAEEKGLTAEKLLQQEIQARFTPPTEEMIRQVYDSTRAETGDLMPPYETVKDDIRQELVKQAKEKAREEFLQSLRADAEVKIMLPPLLPAAVQVPTDGPSRGHPDAPVVIVEFADFECPFCGRAHLTIAQILETYKGKVRFVFRDYPLSYHRFAAKAAEAAHCAGDQGKYWQMHELLYENSHALRVEDLKAYAEELGLDKKSFNKCLDSSQKAKVVEASAALANKLDIKGAPAFFVNGRLISGAQPFEAFQEIIDEELGAAGQR